MDDLENVTQLELLMPSFVGKQGGTWIAVLHNLDSKTCCTLSKQIFGHLQVGQCPFSNKDPMLLLRILDVA